MQGAAKRRQTRYNPDVTSHQRALLVALLWAGGAGCAEVREVTDAAAADGPAADLGSDAAPVAPLGRCTATATVDLSPRPADVLVLLDRSGSMDMAFGAGSRYQAVAAVLAHIVTTYAPYVRFGYQELPGRQGCSGAEAACCASAPTVPLGDGNAQAVLAALAAAAPVGGNTPTAAALRAARDYYAGVADGIDNRYVLLATDGEPDCTLAGQLVGAEATVSAACAEAVAEVTDLVARGVRVLVLGMGPELAGSTAATLCLDQLAHAGGAAASPGSPGYYVAGDADDLARAIERIFGAVARPSCVLPLNRDVTDPSTVALYLDGQQIPRRSPNGWNIDTAQNPPVVEVTDSYCHAIQSFQVRTIEARFGCRACIDIVECQSDRNADAGVIP